MRFLFEKWVQRKKRLGNFFASVISSAVWITLHCSFYGKTKIFFNSVVFLKKGMMLIIASQGATINSKDAIETLKMAKIWSLDIDVYQVEESILIKDLIDKVLKNDIIKRLMSFNNVLITLHQAFFIMVVLDEIAKITIYNFNSFEDKVMIEKKVVFRVSKLSLN